jgi:hypothetical protein
VPHAHGSHTTPLAAEAVRELPYAAGGTQIPGVG